MQNKAKDPEAEARHQGHHEMQGVISWNLQSECVVCMSMCKAGGWGWYVWLRPLEVMPRAAWVAGWSVLSWQTASRPGGGHQLEGAGLAGGGQLADEVALQQVPLHDGWGSSGRQR